MSKRLLAAIVALLMVLTATPVSIAQVNVEESARIGALDEVEYRYVETDSFTAGEEYIVAAAVDETSVYAIKRNDTAVASELLAVTPASNGKAAYITTENENLVWTYTEEGYLTNGGRYLYPIGTSVQTYTNGRVMSYEDGILSYMPSSTPYYITCTDGAFAGSTSIDSAAQIRLFVKTEYSGEEPPAAKAFVIASSNGYALTLTPSENTYVSTGSTSAQQYVYYGLEPVAYTAGDAVTDDMLWTIEQSGDGYVIKALDGRYLNATYVSNSTGAYDGSLNVDNTADVWTYASNRLQSTNASAANGAKYLSYNSNANIFTVRSSSSASTIYFYEYDNGEYVGQADYPVPTPTPTPTPEPTPEPTPDAYHELAGFVEGAAYVLGAVASDNTVWAVKLNGSSITSQELTVYPASGDDAAYVLTYDTTLVWTRTSSDYLQNSAGRYFYPGSSGMNTSSSSGRVVDYVDGHLTFVASGGSTYYVTCSNGSFGTSTNSANAATFRLFTTYEGEFVEPTPTPEPEPTPIAVSEPVNGHTYVIVAGGYALTSNDTDVTIVNNNGAYNYTGLDGIVYEAGQTVGPDALWTIWTMGDGYLIKSMDGRVLNGVYGANNSGGYDGHLNLDEVWDIWTISGSNYKSTNASEGQSSDKFLAHGGASANVFTVRSSSSASAITLYEYTEEGEYTDPGSEVYPTIEPTATPVPTATPEPTPEPEPTPIAVTTPVNGHTYVIVADGYALTANEAAGTYGNSSGTQQYIYYGNTGIAYTPGMQVGTDALWTLWTMGDGYLIKSMDGSILNATYGTNETGGSTGVLKLDEVWDIWTISGSNYKSTNASATASSDKFLAYCGTEYDVISIRSSSSASAIVLYEYTADGEYTDPGTEPYPTIEPTASPVPTATPEPTPEPTPVAYHEVAGFIDGANYIMGAVENDNAVWAVQLNGSNIASYELTVYPANGDDPAYVETYDSTLVWNRLASGYMTCGGRYFYPGSGGMNTSTSGRVVEFVNGHLTFVASGGSTYYVTCSNGAFGTSTDIANAATFRLFTDSNEEYVEPTPTPEPEPTPIAVTTPVNGHTYVIVVGGYALTANEAGGTYSNTGGGSPYVYYGNEGIAYEAGQQVGAEALWTLWTMGDGYLIKSMDGRVLNATYTSHDSGGATGVLKLDEVWDIWTISGSNYKSTNASATSSSDKFLAYCGTEYNVISIRSSSSASSIVLYEYTADGEYTDPGTEPYPTIEPTATPAPTATPEPTPEPTPDTYYETNHFEAGKEYIVAVGEGETVFAIGYDGAIAPVEFIVENGCIETMITTAAWTRTEDNGLLMGGRYMYPTSGGSVTTYTTVRAIAYENGLLSFTSSDGTIYYLNYVDGAFGTTTDSEAASMFRLFVKSDEPPVEPTPEPTATPEPTEPPTPVLIGDVNGDGEVSFADVSALYSLILSGNMPTPEQLEAADVNQDGEITFVDVSYLYNLVIG